MSSDRTLIKGGTAYNRVMDAFKVLFRIVFRELLWNSLEAGATYVRIGWDGYYRDLYNDPDKYENPVFKARCIDNGHGMTPSHMRRYFMTMGETSKTDKNRGHGLRISAMAKNPLGVVVVSKTKNTDFHVAHMRLDKEKQECYLQTYQNPEFDKDDPDNVPDDVPPLDWTPFDYLYEDPIVQEVIGTAEDAHGTVVLLLGVSETDSTYLLQSEKNDNRVDGTDTEKTLQFLNTRAELIQNSKGIRLGEGLRVVVEEMNATKNLWEVSHEQKYGRRASAKGLKSNPDAIWKERKWRQANIRDLDDCIPYASHQRIVDQGTMEVPFKAFGIAHPGVAAEIRWALTTPPYSSQSTKAEKKKGLTGIDTQRIGALQSGPNHGCIAHIYDNEAYEVYWRGADDARKFSAFGIHMPVTKKCTYIFVRWMSAEFADGSIQKPGVWPSADRMKLEFHARERDTVGLPTHVIYNFFKNRMPKAIEESLQAEARDLVGDDQDQKKSYAKLMSQIRDMFDLRAAYRRARPNEDGIPGTFSGQGADTGPEVQPRRLTWTCEDHPEIIVRAFVGEEGVCKICGKPLVRKKRKGGSGGSGSGSKGAQFTPDKDGEDRAVPKSSEGLDVQFVRASELARVGVEEDQELYPGVCSNGYIWVNTDHPIYRTLYQNAQNSCGRAPGEMVVDSLHRIIRRLLVGQTSMFLGHKRDLPGVTAATDLYSSIPGEGILDPRSIGLALSSIESIVKDVKSDVQGRARKARIKT